MTCQEAVDDRRKLNHTFIRPYQNLSIPNTAATEVLTRSLMPKNTMNSELSACH
jgi:hypothetical protein